MSPPVVLGRILLTFLGVLLSVKALSAPSGSNVADADSDSEQNTVRKSVDLDGLKKRLDPPTDYYVKYAGASGILTHVHNKIRNLQNSIQKQPGPSESAASDPARLVEDQLNFCSTFSRILTGINFDDVNGYTQNPENAMITREGLKNYVDDIVKVISVPFEVSTNQNQGKKLVCDPLIDRRIPGKLSIIQRQPCDEIAFSIDFLKQVKTQVIERLEFKYENDMEKFKSPMTNVCFSDELSTSITRFLFLEVKLVELLMIIIIQIPAQLLTWIRRIITSTPQDNQDSSKSELSELDSEFSKIDTAPLFAMIFVKFVHLEYHQRIQNRRWSIATKLDKNRQRNRTIMQNILGDTLNLRPDIRKMKPLDFMNRYLKASSAIEDLNIFSNTGSLSDSEAEIFKPVSLLFKHTKRIMQNDSDRKMMIDSSSPFFLNLNKGFREELKAHYREPNSEGNLGGGTKVLITPSEKIADDLISALDPEVEVKAQNAYFTLEL